MSREPDGPEDLGSDDGWLPVDPVPVGAPASATSPAAAVVGFIVVAVLAWGAFAIFANSDDSGSTVPLGPAGSEMCDEAVQDAKDNVPDAIADAQDNVDDIIAENPELAPYADDAKQNLADAAPEVEANLDAAGDELGC